MSLHPRLPLASHPSTLRAHSGKGLAGGNDQACDRFTAAVDGGRCRRGLLRQSRIPTNQRGSVSEYRAMTTATAWRRSSPCSGDQDCFDGPPLAGTGAAPSTAHGLHRSPVRRFAVGAVTLVEHGAVVARSVGNRAHVAAWPASDLI